MWLFAAVLPRRRRGGRHRKGAGGGRFRGRWRGRGFVGGAEFGEAGEKGGDLGFAIFLARDEGAEAIGERGGDLGGEAGVEDARLVEVEQNAVVRLGGAEAGEVEAVAHDDDLAGGALVKKGEDGGVLFVGGEAGLAELEVEEQVAAGLAEFGAGLVGEARESAVGPLVEGEGGAGRDGLVEGIGGGAGDEDRPEEEAGEGAESHGGKQKNRRREGEGGSEKCGRKRGRGAGFTSWLWRPWRAWRAWRRPWRQRRPCVCGRRRGASSSELCCIVDP